MIHSKKRQVRIEKLNLRFANKFMYPELFRIGNFPVVIYDILIITAMLFGLLLASRLAVHDGLPSGRICDLGLSEIVGGILGSELLLLVTDASAKGAWHFAPYRRGYQSCSERGGTCSLGVMKQI